MKESEKIIHPSFRFLLPHFSPVFSLTAPQLTERREEAKVLLATEQNQEHSVR